MVLLTFVKRKIKELKATEKGTYLERLKRIFANARILRGKRDKMRNSSYLDNHGNIQKLIENALQGGSWSTIYLSTTCLNLFEGLLVLKYFSVVHGSRLGPPQGGRFA